MDSLNTQNEPLVSLMGSVAGRKRQVFDLLSLFQNSQIIGLFGENGSGKSTLIRHGLIPELKKGFLGKAGREWRTVTIRPGISPLENLAAGIAQLGLDKGKQKLEEEVALSTSMRRTNEGLKNACLERFSQKSNFNALLVIDNFEDLFQFKEVAPQVTEWEEQVKSFIHNISKCAGNSSIPVYFLIVLRADYMGRLFEFRHFYETLSSSQYNLPQFRKTEFSEVLQSLLKSTKKTISKDANDQIYSLFGKDLKNLTSIKFYLEELVVRSNEAALTEINLDLLQQVAIDSLYANKIESFYLSCAEVEKKLVERLFKQITVVQDGAKIRKPIRIDHFLKVTGSQLSQLVPVLKQIQTHFDFLLDVILPYQERLEVKQQTLISESAVIDIKNEQFIPHWPRLLDWIKEEKESQDLYKRLSEKASLFDKGLTDYLKPPDLDLALSWYEDQKPDELWSNQFDSNHHKTIAYLLASKVKFQDEILKKEIEQKEKIKRLRRVGIYVIFAAGFILVVIGIFAYDAKKQEAFAQDAREKAVKESKKAKLEKERAELFSKEAKLAENEARKNEQLALFEKMRADEEKMMANKLREEAMLQKVKIEEQFKELDQKKVELSSTVVNLQVSDSLKSIATKEAENARAYQETLNAILSLRNQVQKKDLQGEELQNILSELKSTYANYRKTTFEFKAANLPNNDLYQVLLEIRKKMVEQGIIEGVPEELATLPSGIRKIAVSPTGTIAAGGDDGIILYSKLPNDLGKVPLNRFPIGKDRIRSLDYLNAKELIFGTVNGKVGLFNISTGVNKYLDLGILPNQIVESLVVGPKGVFALVSGQVLKIDAVNPAKSIRVTTISAKNIFKLNQDKLLVVSKDNSLILFDMSTLSWQPVSSDLKNAAITAAISSGESLFLGMENGDISICRTIRLGNVVSIKSELVISSHRTRITSLAYDVSTEKLFSASLDQTANIFDLKLRKLRNDYIANYLYKVEGFDKWIWDFALVQTGKTKTLLTVDESGDLKSWQTGSEMLYDELFTLSKK
uniref:nSTAND1 domain-containing NTPase n=2 Tax=Algoriphagus sp. TaxID=1872435 RepID=UPI004047662F